MKSVFTWHETNKELPQPVETTIDCKNRHFSKVITYKPCLVIWEGKIKPSRYLENEKRWEGHTPTQVPQYWAFIDEIEILDNVGDK